MLLVVTNNTSNLTPWPTKCKRQEGNISFNNTKKGITILWREVVVVKGSKITTWKEITSIMWCVKWSTKKNTCKKLKHEITKALVRLLKIWISLGLNMKWCQLNWHWISHYKECWKKCVWYKHLKWNHEVIWFFFQWSNQNFNQKLFKCMPIRPIIYFPYLLIFTDRP